MKIAQLWILAGLAAFAAGCGQKGPLVQPDAPKHKKAPPAATLAAPSPSATAPQMSPATSTSPVR